MIDTFVVVVVLIVIVIGLIVIVIGLIVIVVIIRDGQMLPEEGGIGSSERLLA